MINSDKSTSRYHIDPIDSSRNMINVSVFLVLTRFAYWWSRELVAIIERRAEYQIIWQVDLFFVLEEALSVPSLNAHRLIVPLEKINNLIR
mmetsp:Transcript_35444/g.69799  ORF Transcript_35444/g.69799 Transcript_35444/m.69799 type:complete len:91 (+) Transcript_35444:25-297(+)